MQRGDLHLLRRSSSSHECCGLHSLWQRHSPGDVATLCCRHKVHVLHVGVQGIPCRLRDFSSAATEWSLSETRMNCGGGTHCDAIQWQLNLCSQTVQFAAHMPLTWGHSLVACIAKAEIFPLSLLFGIAMSRRRITAMCWFGSFNCPLNATAVTCHNMQHVLPDWTASCQSKGHHSHLTAMLENSSDMSVVKSEILHWNPRQCLLHHL